jgi:hypothetical protein
VGQLLGHVVEPPFHLVVFPVDFFSWSSISQKNDIAKRLGLFTCGRSLKLKKQEKTGKPVR